MIERQLRLWTGLVLAVFITLHLCNHALGLISIEAMEAMRTRVMPVWQSPPGTIVLYGAFLIHFVLALLSIYKRSTLKMPAWEAVQLGLGLLIPPLLAIHVVGTRGAYQLLGIDLSYDYVVTIQWTTPRYRIQQPLLVLVAWLHVSFGLHYWLRMKAWYPRALLTLYAVALLVPVLALLGFVRTGMTMEGVIADPIAAQAVFDRWINADETGKTFILGLERQVLQGMGFILLAVLAARLIKLMRRRREDVYRIVHSNGKTLDGIRGQSLLEAIRNAGIPHASVCGGRGRCTTCRVRVGAGLGELPLPSPLERQALGRIGADPNVRLACQTRPLADIDITPLLAPKATPEEVYSPGGVSGREQKVAVMFIDLRDSTGLGEQRLPFDVVFILNQFFSEMSAALESTGGHYAQFSGDGLMALYGLESNMETGCRDALDGALEMTRRMETLNRRLTGELSSPLRIGIGIHCGEAIVGTMGPPNSPNFSAVGDNINIAARLEAQTKTYECALVVSAETAHAAGVDLSVHPLHAAEIRGRDEPVMAYAIHQPLELAGR